MGNFNLWLKACADKNEYPTLIESYGGVFLFQLKAIDNPDYNSYNHYHTTYHVWDKIEDKWVFTSVDYRSAYGKYKDYTRNVVEC